MDVVPNVVIDFMFTISILVMRNTNIPMLTFATIATDITSVLWIVWLQKSAQSASLCKHFLFF